MATPSLHTYTTRKSWSLHTCEKDAFHFSSVHLGTHVTLSDLLCHLKVTSTHFMPFVLYTIILLTLINMYIFTNFYYYIRIINAIISFLTILLLLTKIHQLYRLYSLFITLTLIILYIFLINSN